MCPQALEYFEKAQKPSGLDSDSDGSIDDSMLVNTIARSHPTFEITIRRKFEVVELCEIFFNKWMKYLYLVIMSIYCFLASWSFSTVAGSSWALNIPYNFSRVGQCDGGDSPFSHNALPESETCRNAYYFSLFIFAIVVVSLSLLDLKEQALIQMVLGLMRFMTVGAIIIYSLTKLAQGGDVCDENDPDKGSYYSDAIGTSNATGTYKEVLKFDPRSWLTAVPIFTYAFILHQGIASLTHPIKQKRYMWYLILAMFSTALFCYLSLGVIAPLWFRRSIQETVTLNFVSLLQF